MMAPMQLEDFREAADRWLADNAVSAPPNYGPIVPEGLVGERLLGLPK